MPPSGLKELIASSSKVRSLDLLLSEDVLNRCAAAATEKARRSEGKRTSERRATILV